MKRRGRSQGPGRQTDFSALGRAVWDETVLASSITPARGLDFSALGRAVWDETPKMPSTK